ncbi:NCS2 family permease [Hutsoniella sourekii]
MEMIQDFIAAVGALFNGIPQALMALSLGFAMAPTAFGFVVTSGINWLTGSVAPISFQAESVSMLGRLGDNRLERVSMMFWGSIIMLAIALTGTVNLIVDLLGQQVLAGMMAGVGIMLANIAISMVKGDPRNGALSMVIAGLVYLLTHDLVWTVSLSVIAVSLIARFYFKEEGAPAQEESKRLQVHRPLLSGKIIRGALSLAALNLASNISYGLVTGQLTGQADNPTNLKALTLAQAASDFGASLMGGAPLSAIISTTGSAPHPMRSGVLMMILMALILVSGLLPKIGRFVPSSAIAGFLFVLGVVIVFPSNAMLALQGPEALIAAITIAITACSDPFTGLLSGAALKYLLPLIGLNL